MQYRRHPQRLPAVYCACGQPIGERNTIMGMKRCQRCIEHFARTSGVVKPKQIPLRMLPKKKGAAPPVHHVTTAPPLPLPGVPIPVPQVPGPDPAILTDRRLAAQRVQQEKLVNDARLKRFLELLKQGMPRDRALEESEKIPSPKEDPNANPRQSGNFPSQRS